MRDNFPRRFVALVRPKRSVILFCLATVFAFGVHETSAARGRLDITVIDQQTRQPIACRMHLEDSSGRPQRAGRLPFWDDHFVLPGRVRLNLPAGEYRFEIERGPEYARQVGHFEIGNRTKDRRVIELVRVVDMAEEGWYSADLHIHRSTEDIELLIQAEDLHVAPLITWWNNRNLWTDRELPEDPLVRVGEDRFYHLMAGEDEREGGALLYFNLNRPLAITDAAREYPSPMKFLLEAREQEGVWIDVEKPFWWDVPVWLASGKVDSIGLANNHMQRSGMLANEAWGKPRDSARLPDPRGNALWTQEIYYHVLNCGLRLPPSAGSASGVLKNPVGYNRMYVHVGENFNYDSWWEKFRAGRVMVTNGPLLRPLVAGKLPGHVFRAEPGQSLVLDISARLTTSESGYLEIIKNGEVAHSVRFDRWAEEGGVLPAIRFTESGWLLARAVTDVKNTYRFASTGPYYVEIGEQSRRISRRSAEFFRDWVEERMARIKLDDPRQRGEVLRYQQQALDFWNDLVARANAP